MWRDPRLPPSFRHLAPSVARHIPANRTLVALERLADSLDKRYEITQRIAERLRTDQ